jgi:hypothetical protein
MAKRALGDAWDDVRARLIEAAEAHHDGTGVVMEYFLIVGEKTG